MAQASYQLKCQTQEARSNYPYTELIVENPFTFAVQR
jgi:hypothetical protein